MTLKNLYEEVKNKNTKNIYWYIGAYAGWIVLMSVYITIIWFGYNYVANIFGAVKLTYIQTAIITIWLNFIKHIFYTKDSK